jgi:hypothetical protein
MKETSADFQTYLILACQYAFLEYELGIGSNFALIQLDMETVEELGTCWVHHISVPDAGRVVAKKIQKHQEF